MGNHVLLFYYLQCNYKNLIFPANYLKNYLNHNKILMIQRDNQFLCIYVNLIRNYLYIIGHIH